jgi:hypothetical protein
MRRIIGAAALIWLVTAPASAQAPRVDYSPPMGMKKVLDDGVAQRYEAAGYRMIIGSAPVDPDCRTFAHTWARMHGGRVRLTNTYAHQLGPRADAEIVGGRYPSTIVTTVCSSSASIFVITDIADTSAWPDVQRNIGRVTATLLHTPAPRTDQPSRPTTSGSTAVTVGDAARALSTMRSTICTRYGC